jgi:two-component system, sensor histidine kinase and response regulator
MKALLYQLDAISRKFVAAVLEQQGHCSIVYNSIKDALGAVAREQVDVVLVNVQTDGFSLIRTLREHELAAGQLTAVIALAVGDTKDTRQRCLDAGADDFLSISIREPELLAALARSQVSPNRRDRLPRHAPVETTSVPERPSPGCFDVDAALGRVEGDRELLDELLRLFAEECNNSVREIRLKWNARDAHVLTRLAHTLKGSAANMGANAVSEAALALERQVRSGNLRHAVKQIADLEHEVERLMPELDSYLREGSRRS